MIKILFLQYLYNLSDPVLEDALIDRLSFQRFVGFSLTEKVEKRPIQGLNFQIVGVRIG
ncbi:MAG: transposase [Candidatus Marinimicrobia bacterium]|nr:transposase [Candidatus Neomarinimicrobiota bacterium]